MKNAITFFAFLLISGCSNPETTRDIVDVNFSAAKVPSVDIAIEDVFLNRKNSLWLSALDSTTVSGYVNKFYPNGEIAFRFGVFEGKKEGAQVTYFENGDRRFVEEFRNNRLNGEVKRWSEENGYKLVAHLQYENGKLNGEQKKWYPTGELHKVLNLSMGVEEGIQQAFRKNGVLYANYEAKNGRTFGLIRSNLCVELNDEKIVYNK